MRYVAEMTDTFGGEANYSWVRRVEFERPDNVSDLGLVRIAKRLLGISGERCKRETMGETIVLRPYGRCVIVFIDYIP